MTKSTRGQRGIGRSRILRASIEYAAPQSERHSNRSEIVSTCSPAKGRKLRDQVERYRANAVHFETVVLDWCPNPRRGIKLRGKNVAGHRSGRGRPWCYTHVAVASEPKDDIALLNAWRGGDKRAGSALFARHYELVHRFFRSKVNASNLGDLIQGTFLACVEARERFQGTGSFRSYILGIAYRMLCRHYRSQRRERARIDFRSVSACDLAPSPSQVVVDRREQRLLLAALRRIPVEYQTVLELFYWEGFTAAASAEVLGIPLGTAKSRIRRARQLLHEQLTALAEGPALLESTVMDLDGWARSLRDRVGQLDP